MGARTEKAQFGLGYDHRIQLRNPIKYFIMIKQIVCNRPLQVLAYLVWHLWLIMEESDGGLVLRVFVGFTRIFEKSFLLLLLLLFCNSIVYQRIKSICGIKHGFMTVILFSDVTENR